MVKTRGGGKVPERIEDNYRAFLESHFGSRGQRRAHVRKSEQAKKRAVARARVETVKPAPVRKAPAPKKKPAAAIKKRAPPKKTTQPKKPVMKRTASVTKGVTAAVKRQSSQLAKKPSHRSLVDGLKGMLAKVKNLELLLVLDGSGSMRAGMQGGVSWDSPGNTRFDAVRSLCDKVPDAFGPGRKLRLGIVQFGDDAKVECPLVVDHAQFQTVARQMVFMKSGTEGGLPRAFQHAREMLKGERGAQKMLMFITDGGSVNESVVTISAQIKKENTTVIVVGVGASMQQLNRIATGNHAYSMNDFQQVLEIVKESY